MEKGQKDWTVEGGYKINSDLQYAAMRRRRKLMGMKQILVMMVAVVLAGCGKKDDGNTGVANPEKLITDPIVEKAVREELEKPQGELTEADLEKVTSLELIYTQFTDAGLKEVAKLEKLFELNLAGTKITDAGLKDVAKLQQVGWLYLNHTKVTKAGVAELKKALPNCVITHDFLAPNPPHETP